MTPAADVHDVPAWLAGWRARHWLWWRLQVIGEAALWATSAALALLALTASVALAVAGGVAVALWRTLSGGLVHDVRAMLRAVEASEPSLGNALLTWHEVDSGALATPPVFQRQLANQARAGLRGTRPPAPWRARHWAVAAAAVCAALLLVWLVPAFAPGGNLGDAATSSRQTASTATTGAAVSVSFVVTPPAYTGRPPSEIADASVVDALVGSSVRARYAGLPAGAVVRVGSRAVTMTFPSEGTAQAEAAFEVDASALLTVHDEAGQAVASTAIQAVPDAPPLVRIEQPGQDLRVADAARRVPIVITAADDIGLRMLRLRYTRVSGSGESFEFTDGELPVEVRRASTTSWQGRATIDLTELAMGPGDSLVYHAVARDGRFDAAGLAESERYLIEIPRPGALAGGDFSLPEPEERYALSQRMVIQLTERLLERRTRMAPDEYLREAQGLAVQQRRVRAEFVFLMGGEVVDEVEEAAHSHEVEAGRLDNSGQQELLEAVRQMAQAEQRLTDANLGDALPYEYRALNALHAAFGKARYFMRTLPTPVAIDVSRRGTGDLALASAAAWARAPLPAEASGRARQALSELAGLTPVSSVTAVSSVADDLIALDPGTAAWLGVVQSLVDAFARQRPAAVRTAAIDEVGDALRVRLRLASPAAVGLPLARGADEATLARTTRPPR